MGRLRAERGRLLQPPGQLPFLAFSDIYNNPARVQAHLFPLTELAPIFTSPATAPNFAWIAADEDNNGEGPISLPFGAAPVCPEPAHQSSVQRQGGDQFLQDTLPTILNSPVWQDPTQKSAIFITFDEDYNNLSLGIGNQGNHVLTIVIPSPGAVAARDARRANSLPIDHTTTTACSAPSRTRSDFPHSPTTTNSPNP